MSKYTISFPVGTGQITAEADSFEDLGLAVTNLKAAVPHLIDLAKAVALQAAAADLPVHRERAADAFAAPQAAVPAPRTAYGQVDTQTPPQAAPAPQVDPAAPHCAHGPRELKVTTSGKQVWNCAIPWSKESQAKGVLCKGVWA